MSRHGVRVGAAKYCITPPYPIAMGGYIAREGAAEGIHDDLYVRCVYIQDQNRAYVLLAYDLLGLPESFVEQVSRQLCERFAVTSEQIVMHATHTHAGPDLGLEFGITKDPMMPLYIEMLEKWSVSVCAEAKRLCQPVSITEGTTDISEVGGIRRNGKSSKLPIKTIGFVTDQGNIMAALISFPCHPTVMGANNRLISAEYPGVCVKTIERLLGESVVGLFLNGATGDISTRFTRRSQSFDEVDRIGKTLGAAAVSTLLTSRTLPFQQLYVGKRQIRFTADGKYNDSKLMLLKERAEKALENTWDPGQRRVYETQLQGIEYAMRQREKNESYNTKIDISVSVWVFTRRVGLVFWSGEPFFNYDQEIKNQISSQFTLVGYTDGMAGYIPDITIEEDPSYEVLMSLLGKSGGEQLLELSKEMYKSIEQPSGDDKE